MQYTNEDLAQLATWAESQEREAKSDLHRRGAGAIRQGADWMLRARTLEQQVKIAMVPAPPPKKEQMQ